jgi:hypothetical protein
MEEYAFGAKFMIITIINVKFMPEGLFIFPLPQPSL